MAVDTESRVAVYIDFDNVVISWRERAQKYGMDATVDFDAILDFASSFGTVTISRAYADWSRAENAAYQKNLIRRAVDLTQLFETTREHKNGADIRLAIDVVEDLFRLHDISHIVIVAGDSDYIPLAQRAKRLGRHVIGIGVAGSTSRLLAAACDQFFDYDNLPGLHADDPDDADEQSDTPKVVAEPASESDEVEDTHVSGAPPISKKRASQLLLRALEFGAGESDNDWQPASRVKNMMLRMEPSFQESALGFNSFSDFVRARLGLVEFDDKTPHHRIRLRTNGQQK